MHASDFKFIHLILDTTELLSVNDPIINLDQNVFNVDRGFPVFFANIDHKSVTKNESMKNKTP